ncbi:hypothetical protein NDU88_011309 [Pleurodeles waltl]|uniref:Uncharacterized protein n=1 Tax=Pleurodeles waltl TaxID=8319 RepID=A0AAV7QWV4_PLEWA|nr:hypothetical protein NDU88_011309 [Pleurodeles waltl]
MPASILERCPVTSEAWFVPGLRRSEDGVNPFRSPLPDHGLQENRAHERRHRRLREAMRSAYKHIGAGA